MKAAVVCIGSPFGDDALGLVAAPLIEEAVAARGVAVHVLDRPGLRLATLLSGLDLAVLVDAVRSGAPPGTLHRLTGAAAYLRLARHTSTHGFGVAEALALAQRLGLGPARWVLLGLELARLEGGLSDAVEAALPRLVAAVCEEFAQNGGKS